jgi:hypothetical protein
MQCTAGNALHASSDAHAITVQNQGRNYALAAREKGADRTAPHKRQASYFFLTHCGFSYGAHVYPSAQQYMSQEFPQQCSFESQQAPL